MARVSRTLQLCIYLNCGLSVKIITKSKIIQKDISPYSINNKAITFVIAPTSLEDKSFHLKSLLKEVRVTNPMLIPKYCSNRNALLI